MGKQNTFIYSHSQYMRNFYTDLFLEITSRDCSIYDLCPLQTSAIEYHEITHFCFLACLKAFNPILKEGF